VKKWYHKMRSARPKHRKPKERANRCLGGEERVRGRLEGVLKSTAQTSVKQRKKKRGRKWERGGEKTGERLLQTGNGQRWPGGLLSGKGGKWGGHLKAENKTLLSIKQERNKKRWKRKKGKIEKKVKWKRGESHRIQEKKGKKGEDLGGVRGGGKRD